MIVCSCNEVSDTQIDCVLIELMRLPEPPLPTPGVVLRHLSGKMDCCGCAPLLVQTIYERLAVLEKAGLVHAELSASMRVRLSRLGASFVGTDIADVADAANDTGWPRVATG